MLYIVPTPIGNLEDMTLRAVRVLKEADIILSEDTRTTSVLLRHFDIHTPLQSYHMHNEHEKAAKIIEILKKGATVALVSDAGTPGISDPGFLLSRECRREGIDVVCLPGPTALIPALVDSGLPCDRFVFEGFLPPKKGRATRLSELSLEPRTVVIYESPKRLPRTLGQLAEYFGEDREAAISREISKIHETTHKGTLKELFGYFAENTPKGEIVIVIKGNNRPPASKKEPEPKNFQL